MKDFKEELYKFINFVEQGKNFALSRISDGEHVVLIPQREFLTRTIQKDFSWKNDEPHKKSRDLLLEACMFKDDHFYIGLPTHGTRDFFDKMKGFTRQTDEYLTHATLYMDSNFKYWDKDMINALKKRKIIGVFHEKSDTTNTGLTFEKTFTIGHSAYVHDLHVIDEIEKYILEHKIKNHVFLITGAPFANIAIHKLFKIEKENTYIDIGAALDARLGLGFTREFLNPDSNHWSVNNYHPRLFTWE